jgi:uncharacterized membrane protein
VSLFGTSELAFRSMSLMFALVAIVFGFLLVRRLFGRKAALLTVAFLALSPMLVRYGQEARMYTMVAAIAMIATYVLTIALESKRRRPWIVYGVVVALGMLTHYFMALVWITHWLWRLITLRQAGARGTELRKQFFSREWMSAHIVAFALFVLWLPLMAIQLGVIQGNGFWIGSVSVDTLPGYITNVLFYLENGMALGWYGAVAVLVVTILSVYGFKLYKSLGKKQRSYFLLIILLAVVPVLLLFVASLPPLKSSFVERYLMPSIVSFSLVAGIVVAVGMSKLKLRWQVLTTLLIVGSMAVGVANVYHYGNYNKNSDLRVNTKQLVAGVAGRAAPGEPIIADSPWLFYEAVFYDSVDHPVYFINANVDYKYGSLDMLKYNDAHKIKDLAAFMKLHPRVWYISYTNNQTVSSPDGSWKKLQEFTVHDAIDDSDPYKAAEFKG